ncbi:MAG: pyridoxamine 5'-phosphate oxidase family protein [Vicinamibacterales bacterium]
MYHRGEIAVQELAGERSQAVLNGRVFSSVIPAPARPFVAQQSCVAIGWRDPSGNPWASLVVGEPGFASCDPDGTAVTVRTTSTLIPPGSVHGDVPATGAVGMLVIDLATRRRLRVNGVIERATASELHVAVEQAFPNCPKYIQRRERVDAATLASATTMVGLGAPAQLQSWLTRTDTAFVASVGPDGRIDCSHRGGRRGYMRLDGDAVVVPDYPGNSMFCSLGNMTVEPRAGLVLVDFETRQQLHLSGEVSVEIASTRRAWILRPRAWVLSPLAGATRWRLVDQSPFNPPIEA